MESWNESYRLSLNLSQAWIDKSHMPSRIPKNYFISLNFTMSTTKAIYSRFYWTFFHVNGPTIEITPMSSQNSNHVQDSYPDVWFTAALWPTKNCNMVARAHILKKAKLMQSLDTWSPSLVNGHKQILAFARRKLDRRRNIVDVVLCKNLRNGLCSMHSSYENVLLSLNVHFNGMLMSTAWNWLLYFSSLFLCCLYKL